MRLYESLNTIVPILYTMESVELFAKEFLKEKERFDSMGYELIGTKLGSNEIKYFTVRKKND